jgi:hypothetical protein
MPRLLRALPLLLLTLLPRTAAAYDPALGWHTVETPHFVLSYHDGLGLLAQKAARALEAAHQRLVLPLGHLPSERVQVVLTDETDSANGSASAFMRPEIHLLAVPPDSRSELNDYEDYLWNLITHEYTHVLHLDEISGVPALVNKVFGQLWIPNNVQPLWLVEGLAVFEESKLSGSGRERSSIYEMYLRAEVLDDAFFEIDDIGGYPTRWPRMVAKYLHGSHFLEYVAGRFGADAFRRISRSYGAQIIPFAVNRTARVELGASWLDLYDEWKRHVYEEVEALADRVEARGLTEITELSRAGENTGEPRFLPDGRLLYVEDNGDQRPRLRVVDPAGGQPAQTLVELYNGATLAAAPDGKSAVISQQFSYRQFYDFEDLYRVDLATGAFERLTEGARATEPDVGRDGKTLVASRRLGAGRSGLIRLEGRGEQVIYEAPRDHVVYTPRLSPDGKTVAFSEQRPEGRDIRLLDLASGAVRDVTRDRALDLDPAFDPSGRWLLFASDRSGIYNLYARDLTTGETLQVTNLLTGAFKPDVAPDSSRIAFVTYSSRGYDVASMPFDPARWRAAAAQDLERPKAEEWESQDLYPTHEYQPWKTLLPRYWLPTLSGDPRGAAVGLVTGGNDVVGLHEWGLSAGLGLQSRQPYVDLSWAAHVLYPDLFARASSYFAAMSGGPSGSVERQSSLGLSASFPFRWRDLGFSASLGCQLTYYDPFALPPPREPDGALPFFPDRGLAATASVGLGFSNAQRFANAISAERGWSASVSLRGAGQEIGSQFRYATVEAAVSKYLLMPWLEHHALAMRLAGAVGVGDLGRRRLYAIGGIGFHDPLLDALNLRTTGGVALRGYKPGQFAGNNYLLGNLEYRFPLWVQNFGAWTLPFYLRRLHAAVTFDVGEAGQKLDWRQLRPSAGFELRDEMYLGYGLLTNLRLGYARGLGPEGINEFFVALGGGF